MEQRDTVSLMEEEEVTVIKVIKLVEGGHGNLEKFNQRQKHII